MSENAVPYISTLPMTQDEWIAGRKTYLGGSDIGAVLGLSKYKTPYDIWEIKTGKREQEDLSNNEYVTLGNDMEDIIAAKFCKMTGHEVRRDNKVRLHAEYPFLAANIDRLIVRDDKHKTPGLLEIKTTSSYAMKQWELGIPYDYHAQHQHYFGITGFEWGYFAIFNFDKRETTLIQTAPDPAFIKKITDYAAEWWQEHVIKDVPPDLTIKEFERFADAGTSLTASEDLFRKVETVKLLKEKLKADDLILSAMEEEIKEFLGTNEILEFGGTTIATWKGTTSNRIDTTLFKKENPELAAKYTKESFSRRFLIK